ncbi:hypothetical protein KCU62_g6073, partial [Aureobasidium sp. EXF-3399]
MAPLDFAHASEEEVGLCDLFQSPFPDGDGDDISATSARQSKQRSGSYSRHDTAISSDTARDAFYGTGCDDSNPAEPPYQAQFRISEHDIGADGPSGKRSVCIV